MDKNAGPSGQLDAHTVVAATGLFGNKISPVVENLSSALGTLLGRDISPEAVASLQPPALISMALDNELAINIVPGRGRGAGHSIG